MARVDRPVTQIAVAGVAVEYGGTTLFEDVTFTVARGERWGVVGRNGSGKTTLFRLLTGRQAPSRGTVARASGLRFALMDQYREFAGADTVWDAAADAFRELLELERSLGAQAAALAEAGDRCTPAMLARYDRDLERFEREGGYTVPARIDAVLHGLGFDPAAAREQPCGSLSGGERGRLALVRQLVAPADVLLLDEPTNHLDLETTRWLEDYLRALDATVLLISHDRAFLQGVVDHVVHLEGGSAFPYSGDYASFVHQRAERRLAETRAFTRQAKAIAVEEDYIRRNIAGNNSAQARGRRRRLDRLERLSPPADEDGAMALRFTPDERGSDQVLVAESVSLEIGDRTLLRDFSGSVRRGDVVGLIGPNGAGKSTLLGVLTGERTPDGGQVRVPDSVRIGYYRQDLGQLPPGETLYDIVAHLRPQWGRGAIQAHLGRFGFSGDAVQRRPATLSGGERARVALAVLMLSGANFLVLDEPTNHLDVESVEALEDALDAYEGTVLLVSHDRALLRALTSRLWVLRDGRIADYPGGFADWEAAERERATAAAAPPAAPKARASRPERRRKDDRRRRGADRRTAELAVAEAESAVGRWESRLAELQAVLEDPALYAAGDAGPRAAALGREMAEARAELDRAFERWATAAREAETLDGDA
ncbi:MAG TPA: ABC-F family ATP-binding cassette domain-containing protein [Gemmatimonadales bacterium]